MISIPQLKLSQPKAEAMQAKLVILKLNSKQPTTAKTNVQSAIKNPVSASKIKTLSRSQIDNITTNKKPLKVSASGQFNQVNDLTKTQNLNTQIQVAKTRQNTSSKQSLIISPDAIRSSIANHVNQQMEGQYQVNHLKKMTSPELFSRIAVPVTHNPKHEEVLSRGFGTTRVVKRGNLCLSFDSNSEFAKVDMPRGVAYCGPNYNKELLEASLKKQHNIRK